MGITSWIPIISAVVFGVLLLSFAVKAVKAH